MLLHILFVLIFPQLHSNCQKSPLNLFSLFYNKSISSPLLSIYHVLATTLGTLQTSNIISTVNLKNIFCHPYFTHGNSAQKSPTYFPSSYSRYKVQLGLELTSIWLRWHLFLSFLAGLLNLVLCKDESVAETGYRQKESHQA